MDAQPNTQPLAKLRAILGWPQITMATEMGMSLRAYQAIEVGETPMRRIHQLAAERVQLHHAFVQCRPELAKGQLLVEAVYLTNALFGRSDPVPQG